MNTKRCLLHLGIIAAAGLAGWGVRMLLRPAQASNASTETAKTSDGKPPGAAATKSAEPIATGPSLSSLTAEEWAQLEKSVREAPGDSNPLNAQAAAALQLLMGLHDTADFERALGVLNSMPAQEDAREQWPVSLWDVLFKRWAQRDPKGAMDAVLRVANRRKAFGSLQLVLKAWMDADLAAAQKAIQEAPPGLLRSHGTRLMFDYLASRDPGKALEMASNLTNPQERQSAIQSTVATWLEKDAEAAISWVASRPAGERNQLAETVVGRLSFMEGAKAWELAARLSPESKGQHSIRDRVLSSWAQMDPDAALSAALALPESADQLAYLNTVGRWGFQRGQATESMQAVLEKLPVGAQRDAFLSGRIYGLTEAQQSPDFKQAVSLIQSFPDGKPRADLWSGLGEAWGRRDPVGASEWIAHQPSSADRDAFLGNYVRQLFPNDPEAALTWSASISDSGKRGRRLDELLPKWKQKDAAAAAKWVAENQFLSAAERERFGR